MRKIHLLLSLALFPFFLFSQNPTVSGTVQDGEGKPLSYVNVLLFEIDGSTAIKGVVTEENGSFSITLPEEKSYNLQCSFVGYKTVMQKVSPPYKPLIIQLKEDTEALEETVVIARKPIIRREAGKLIFDVENSSMSTGNTVNLLSKAPGVLVLGNSISIKNLPTTIFINGKRVYLSNDEVMSLLSGMDAAVVKQVEVITNPSSKYDADAGAVLNIVTSKAVSIGYKGSVSTTYEQGIFSKYRFTTSHFYKNNWLNVYGSYTYSPRKENKKDESSVIFFNPDSSIHSYWENDFRKITRIESHQANVIADITINQNNTLSISAAGLVTPYKEFDNTMSGVILNASKQIDSTYSAFSKVNEDLHNLSFNVSHIMKIGDKGANLNTSANYISYQNTTNQNVNTNYFSSQNILLTNNVFFTEAQQNTDIFVIQTDFSTPFMKGDLETGVKYSSIQTLSGIDFYLFNNNTLYLDSLLSDLFDYSENIFAGYINYKKGWEKWELSLGVRAENTDVTGDSESLGVVNSQNYLNWFPSVSIIRVLKNGNPLEISYKRSIQRPRYQSLNPFKYFVNETFVSEGSPTLVPAIDDKITVSYSHKNKWFFEAYYWFTKNNLSLSSFVDNETQTIQQLDINVNYNFQYSFDVMYAGFATSWWYLQASTSTFYMENKFNAIKSSQETYRQNTLGFYANIFNRYYLTKNRNFSADIIFYYLSDMIAGTLKYNDQARLNISLWKSLWNKKASISIGTDDILNTFNVPVNIVYYNQNLNYFPHLETQLFRFSFKYNFGNARLRDNKRTIHTDEGDRIK